ncbi:MAG: hypothetical protein AVDCRST_MAG02-3787 [uncultured Rubrobacteraceae bacterium]|uniref:Uncharacterized protein n=1 Tax=uncultured Rubrobacteraceae bacterium TaxID=349277 RepID=A0A6J4RG84_9ACTN|nr:MAG: hypothetical protein AVDCRST_MAG02-3787 [uncultured Rubrobacteraceae bacterium]
MYDAASTGLLTKISGLRRSGYPEAAGELRAKLDRLRRLWSDGAV